MNRDLYDWAEVPLCAAAALFLWIVIAAVFGITPVEPAKPVTGLDFSVSFPSCQAPEMELCASDAIPETAEEMKEIGVTFGILYEAAASDSLGEMITRADVTVIDFTASWCGPCQHLLPEYEKLSAEFEDVCFWTVDIEKCPSLCQEAGGISSVPCVKVYSGVNEVGQVTGNYPARLRGLLLSVLRERRE